MDVGGTLRRERMRQHMTLDQVARSTKIGVTTLEALENNDFDRLPASIYTRGFLRSYAREIGLNPEEIVEQYFEQFDRAPSIVLEPDISDQTSAELPSGTDSSAGVYYGRQLPGPILMAVIGVIVLASYLTYASRSDRTTDSGGGVPAAAPGDAQAVGSNPTQPAIDATRAAASTPPVAPAVLRVELAATGPCWVSVGLDGAQPVGRLMQAGERQTAEANHTVRIRLGDPAAMAMSINGVPAKPLGQSGQPVTVDINKQNFQTYLAQS